MRAGGAWWRCCPNGSRLILFGNTLFGTASSGAEHGSGTLFALDADGSDVRTIYSFSRLSPFTPHTNTDGANPQAELVISGNVLYGTALYGGHAGNGTMFSVNIDGTDFRTLHSFSEAVGNGPYYTNFDGIFPQSELVMSGSILYGTAYGGGDAGFGTMFSINTDGTAFSVLHTFSGLDGANPIGGLVRTDDSLYGTTADGGCAHGTVFRISFFPQLIIEPGSEYVHLMWLRTEAGFDYSQYFLEWTSDLGFPSWRPVASLPLNLHPWSRISIPIEKAPHFYRLRKSP